MVTLVQVPSQTILLTFLPIPNDALTAGGHFELKFRLDLLPVYDAEAHDVVMTIDPLDPFLNEAPMMMVDYCNGTIATLSKLAVLGMGS